MFFGIFQKPIIWILLFAFLLRLWGVVYGFPLFLVNDEPAFVLGALKMMELKTLVPARHTDAFRTVLAYPPLPSYLFLVTLAPVLLAHYLAVGMPPLAEYQALFTLDPSFLWIAARVVNILLGVLLIAVTYRIAERVSASRRAALIAAGLLAVSFYHLQLSAVVRHWMPAALLLGLGWLVALPLRERASLRRALGAGLLLGLAAAVNTSALVGILPAAGLIAVGRRDIPRRARTILAELALIGCAALLVLALTVAFYPYGFTRAEGGGSVGGDLAMRFGFLATKSVAGWLAFLATYASLLIRYEFTLALAALLGAFLLARRDPWFVAMAVSFFFLYLTALYLFFNPIPRALLFLLPFLAVLGGYGVHRVAEKLRNWDAGKLRNGKLESSGAFVRNFSIYIFFVLVFAYPLLVDLRYDMLAARSDTRLVARAWIGEHIPAGTAILADTPYLRLTNTKEGIRELAALDPGALRAADRVLADLPDERYPESAYRVLNLHFLPDGHPVRIVGDPAFFRAQGFRYIVIEYEYRDRSDMNPHTRRLVHGLRRVEHFSPYSKTRDPSRALDLSGEIATIPPSELFQLERFGLFVDIYEL